MNVVTAARHRARATDRRRGEHGAAAVEFALVLPLLVALILGIVTAGISYSQALGLANGVREGSRFAATTPYPPASGDWKDDVIARTRLAQADDPNSASRICVDLYKQGATTPRLVDRQCAGDATLGNPAAFTAPTSTPAGTCVVRVWAARYFTINAFLVRFDNNKMTRSSTAVYERTPCGP